MINIDIDEDQSFIDRGDFVKSAIEDIKDDLNTTMLVTNITNNSVTYQVLDEFDNPHEVIVNISDQDIDFSLKLITLSLISAKFNQLPKIGILLKSTDSDVVNSSNSPIKDEYNSPDMQPVAENSEGQEELPYLDVVGLSVIDMTGVLYSDISNHEYDFTAEISSSYIQNAFQQNGIISLSSSDYEESKKLFLVDKSESFINPDDEFHDKFEVAMGTINVGIATQENRSRKRWKRRIRLNRRKDAAGHRLRSLAARLRWKKFRGKILRSMKKFNKSRAGKLSRIRKGRKLSMLNKLGLIGRKDGY